MVTDDYAGDVGNIVAGGKGKKKGKVDGDNAVVSVAKVGRKC